jgi:hypothetical protein
MKSEIATIDQDETTPAPAQEVEFALVLARMINTIKQDPAQLRFTVYELARSKLADEISWADEGERKRLLTALEVAIKGVEQFSAREQEERRQAPEQSQAVALGPGALPQANNQIAVSAQTDSGIYANADWRPSPPSSAKRRPAAWLLVWMVGGIVSAGTLTAAIYLQRGSLSPVSVVNLSPGSIVPRAPTEMKPAPQPPDKPPFPIPTDYGVYVLNDGKLSELDALPEQVPDKRVSVSTPVSNVSHTVLPDGHAKFVAFRRDLAGNAPDRVDVRVVAQVRRSLTFDAKGKASYSAVSGEWNIRNTAYQFRVRPILGNPEMLLIQPENLEFALPAGRYVLALKNQGYDFTVAGQPTEASQCLERTDAANGTFYSDCEK